MPLLSVLFALLVLGACGRAEEKAPPPVPAGKAVVATPFASLAYQQSRDAAASVTSGNESRIAAEVSGRIEAIPVRAGERVAAGSVLLRLDPADYRLAVQRAEAALAQAAARAELALAQLARTRDLAAKGFVSPDAAEIRATESAIAEADRQAAAAQLDTARRALEKTVVRAPFAGTLRSREAQVGETVSPGQPLLTLVDAGGVEVVAQLGAEDAANLGAAEGAAFVLGGVRHPLRLLRVSPVVDPQTRLVEVRFAFREGSAPIGSAGRVQWRDAASSLPATVFVRRNGVYGVFAVEDGKARFLPLPGVQEGRPARVALAPETRVISAGMAALQDGDVVVASDAAAR